jgi:hypothetical protein
MYSGFHSLGYNNFIKGDSLKLFILENRHHVTLLSTFIIELKAKFQVEVNEN